MRRSSDDATRFTVKVACDPRRDRYRRADGQRPGDRRRGRRQPPGAHAARRSRPTSCSPPATCRGTTWSASPPPSTSRWSSCPATTTPRSAARARPQRHLHRRGIPCDAPRPRGVVHVDQQVVDVAGLRIAGLGGCVRYRARPSPVHPAAVRTARVSGWLRRARAPRRSTCCSPTPRRSASATARTGPHVGIEALHPVLARLAADLAPARPHPPLRPADAGPSASARPRCAT